MNDEGFLQEVVTILAVVIVFVTLYLFLDTADRKSKSRVKKGK